MGPLIAMPASSAAADTGAWSHATPIILAVLGSSVVAGLVSTALGSLRASAAARRDRYAEAMQGLVAWHEYPYRIRRRVDDSAETLDRLSAAGHDLQERLASNRAWIAGESPTLHRVYELCIQEISSDIGLACRQAWATAPVTTAVGMNLAGFTAGNAVDAICKIETALAYRFGWRRMLPTWIVARRLRQRDCLPSEDENRTEVNQHEQQEASSRSPA